MATLVAYDGIADRFLFRNVGFDPCLLNGIPQTAGVVAVITQQLLCLGKVVEQSGSAGLFADLPCGHEEAERASVCIDTDMPRPFWYGRSVA